MKGVFDTKPNSGYNDEVERYHFPTQSNYRATAQAVLGDWVIYREPQRNNGRRAYVAVARVARIEADPILSNHAYAVMEDYLPFDRPVPFLGDHGAYWEDSLRAIGNPRRVGAALQGKALRVISDQDFANIVQAGLRETLAPENALRLGLGFEDVEQPIFQHQEAAAFEARRIEQVLINRKVRDANFRRQVCEAYDDRCAVTRLRIINGGGRSEVQAAHIWGVGEGGPDVVQNGLALSSTVHWLFDRHLISLTDDYKLLVSHNKVPAEFRSLFEKQLDRIHLPTDERLWPHQGYIRRHREAFMAY